MLTELNERLEKWREEKAFHSKWTRQLDQLKKELKDKQHEVQQWQQQLSREQADVEKLNGLSIHNLFYTVLGKKEDMIDQEKKEVIEAKLKYDEATDTEADMQQEIQKMEKRLRELGNLDAEYQIIYNQKEQLIHDQASPMSEELYEMIDQKAEINAYLKEIKEAIRAGESVQASLQRAANSLDSARNWGTWDMLGGGMISTAVKHSRINESQQHIHDAQRKMRNFEKELKDIELHIKVHFNTDGMIKFADFFFDGLIVDWMVQGRINNSREQVKGQMNKISKTTGQLRSEKNKCESQVNALQAKYTTIIERT